MKPEITNDLLDRALAAYWGPGFPGTTTSGAIHTMRSAMRECLEAVMPDLVEVVETHGDRYRLRECGVIFAEIGDASERMASQARDLRLRFDKAFAKIDEVGAA